MPLNFRFCTLALLCVCLLFAAPALASSSADTDGQFVLDKSTVVSGEPVWLTFRLVNHGTNVIHFYESGSRFTAYDKGGHIVSPLFSRAMVGGMVRHVSVAPSGSYQQRLFLPDWFTLHKPGAYTLKCKWPVDAGPLVESDLPFTVLPPDKRAMGLVIQALGGKAQSDDSAARDEAAISLQAISDPRIVPPLAALLVRPDPPVRISLDDENALEDSKYEAILGLSHFPSDTSAQALMAVMNEDDDELRRAAGGVLQKMHYADRVLPSLRQALRSPSVPKRMAAIRSVASLQDPRGFGPLVNSLHDPVPAVRVEAAKALGTLRDRRAVPVLRSHFHDPDLTLRFACIESLVPLRYPVLSQWLTPIVRSYAFPGHEHPALEAIVALRRDCGDWAALESCLHFDDPCPSHVYNFFLIQQMDACHNGSEYAPHWVHGSDTLEAIENNRKVLAAIKRGFPAQ